MNPETFQSPHVTLITSPIVINEVDEAMKGVLLDAPSGRFRWRSWTEKDAQIAQSWTGDSPLCSGHIFDKRSKGKFCFFVSQSGWWAISYGWQMALHLPDITYDNFFQKCHDGTLYGGALMTLEDDSDVDDLNAHLERMNLADEGDDRSEVSSFGSLNISS